MKRYIYNTMYLQIDPELCWRKNHPAAAELLWISDSVAGLCCYYWLHNKWLWRRPVYCDVISVGTMGVADNGVTSCHEYNEYALCPVAMCRTWKETEQVYRILIKVPYRRTFRWSDGLCRQHYRFIIVLCHSSLTWEDRSDYISGEEWHEWQGD